MTSKKTRMMCLIDTKFFPILNGTVHTNGIGGLYELEQKLENNYIHAEKKSIVRTFSFLVGVEIIFYAKIFINLYY